VQFEWDEAKAARNLEKHGVSFREAITVFQDTLSRTFPDPFHSMQENRYITIGESAYATLLVIAHTDRGDKVRIISAREVTRQERRFYEQGF
jgi:uncharacterized DUF497 family protein